MRKLVRSFLGFVVLMILLANSAFSQKYVFAYEMKEFDELQNPEFVGNHPFGDEFAEKMQLIKEMYTYTVKNEISLQTSTVVEKMAIFNSVKKSNKYLVKSVKKGSKNKDEAMKELEDILVKVINIRYQDTEDLEGVLWKTKEPESIVALYSTEIKLNM